MVSKFFTVSAKPLIKKKKKKSYLEVQYSHRARGEKATNRVSLPWTHPKMFTSPGPRGLTDVMSHLLCTGWNLSGLSLSSTDKKAEIQGNCYSFSKYMLRVKMLRKIIQLAKNRVDPGAWTCGLPQSSASALFLHCFPLWSWKDTDPGEKSVLQ